MADPFLIPEFHWKQAQLKLKMGADGSLKGIIGGYHDWYALYWSYAESGWVEEHSASVDMPALYYSLKRNADAYPDPKTGENTAISTPLMKSRPCRLSSFIPMTRTTRRFPTLAA